MKLNLYFDMFKFLWSSFADDSRCISPVKTRRKIGEVRVSWFLAQHQWSVDQAEKNTTFLENFINASRTKFYLQKGGTCPKKRMFGLSSFTSVKTSNSVCPRTSRACLRKVLFSAFAHSMHSRHSSTSCPVAASMSRKRSSRERTSRAALALLMEIRKGLTNFRRPPSSGGQKHKTHIYFRHFMRLIIHKDWWDVEILPAACPVLAKSVPNSRILCSLTLTASSSFSWTSLLTVAEKQVNIRQQNIEYGSATWRTSQRVHTVDRLFL